MADLVDIAAPRVCAGCRRPGASLCGECEDQLIGVPRLHRPTPAPSAWLPVHVVSGYAGTTRVVITAWKERGRRDVAPVLARALAVAIAAAMRGDEPTGAQTVIVPIPSSRAAVRRRGEDAWGRVVRTSVDLLRAQGASVRIDHLLQHVRQPRDQSGLTALERRRNLDGALTCVRRPTGPVIVVDDIVTTGSTLAAAAQALTAAGARHPCGAAIAATSRDRSRSHPAD